MYYLLQQSSDILEKKASNPVLITNTNKLTFSKYSTIGYVKLLHIAKLKNKSFYKQASKQVFQTWTRRPGWGDVTKILCHKNSILRSHPLPNMYLFILLGKSITSNMYSITVVQWIRLRDKQISTGKTSLWKSYTLWHTRNLANICT